MNLKLTKKEQQLADLLECTPGGRLNIGYVCRKLRTTPRTLLGETLPGLRKKLEAHATVRQVAIARKAANYASGT